MWEFSFVIRLVVRFRFCFVPFRFGLLQCRYNERSARTGQKEVNWKDGKRLKVAAKKKFELKKNTIIKEKKTILMKKMNIITELTEETWNEWRDDKRTTDTLDYPLHSAFKAKSFTFLPCFTQKRYCFSCQQCLKKRLLYLCWAWKRQRDNFSTLIYLYIYIERPDRLSPINAFDWQKCCSKRSETWSAYDHYAAEFFNVSRYKYRNLQHETHTKPNNEIVSLPTINPILCQ